MLHPAVEDVDNWTNLRYIIYKDGGFLNIFALVAIFGSTN